MIKVLYGDTDLADFEYGENVSHSNGLISDFEFENIPYEEFHNLIKRFCDVLNIDFDDYAEIHISNLNDDGNMELFGEDVLKEIEFKVGDFLIKFSNNSIDYISEDGRIIQTSGLPEKLCYFNLRLVRRVDLEYQLFMIRNYGEDYRNDILNRMNRLHSVYRKKEFDRVKQEVPINKTVEI